MDLRTQRRLNAAIFRTEGSLKYTVTVWNYVYFISMTLPVQVQVQVQVQVSVYVVLYVHHLPPTQ